MIETLSEKTRVARKDHECMACVWIMNCDNSYIFSFSELRIIAKAKAQNYKILKGQKYVDSRCKDEGYLYIFRCIPEIHEICIRHDIYQL